MCKDFYKQRQADAIEYLSNLYRENLIIGSFLMAETTFVYKKLNQTKLN